MNIFAFHRTYLEIPSFLTRRKIKIKSFKEFKHCLLEWLKGGGRYFEVGAENKAD